MDYALTDLQIQVIRQGGLFIAYSHALDLSTTGKSEKQAIGRFEDVLHIFIREVIKNETEKKGIFNQALLNLGWTQKAKR